MQEVKYYSNRQIREQREFETLHKNPKYARAMWQENVYARWSAPALPPIKLCDKDGNELTQSIVERAVYENLCKELEEKGLSRGPTNGEMTEACQDYYSRHNSSAYVARRDGFGAKPVDESKQSMTVNNPLENYTEEELLVMQKALEEMHKKQVEQTEREQLPEVTDDK